jgi:hypothetical protein
MTTTTTYFGPTRRNSLTESRSRHPTAKNISRSKRRKVRVKHAGLFAQPKAALSPQFYTISIIMFVLTMLGLVMVFSSSSIALVNKGNSGWGSFQKQLMWSFLGVICLFITMKVHYKFWRRLVKPLLLLSLALMVVLTGVALTQKKPANASIANTYQSFMLGSIRVQPSEILKLTLLLYVVDLFARRERRVRDPKVVFYPSMVLLGISSVLLLLQEDLGGAIILSVIVFSVAYFAGVPFKNLLLTAIGAGLVGTGAIFSRTYRRDRFLAFLDIEGTRKNVGYQVECSCRNGKRRFDRLRIGCWQSKMGLCSGINYRRYLRSYRRRAWICWGRYCLCAVRSVWICGNADRFSSQRYVFSFACCWYYRMDLRAGHY